MFAKALIFLANTVFGLFTIALLLRFYMQWARAAYRNPLSEFLSALTDFMVRPARRVIPGLWGLDLATLVLAWLIQVLEWFVILQIKDYPLASAAGSAYAGLALLAAVAIVKLGLYILIAVVVFQAVLSWINPYTPLAPLLNGMTRPFLHIFRKLIPPIGNVDLSPLVVIVICQLLLMLPVAYFEMTLSRWF